MAGEKKYKENICFVTEYLLRNNHNQERDNYGELSQGKDKKSFAKKT